MWGRFLANSNRKYLCIAHRHDNNYIHVPETLYSYRLAQLPCSHYCQLISIHIHPYVPPIDPAKERYLTIYEERQEFGTMKKKMIQL